MVSYFIRRFLLIIPTFIGITLMVFTITRFVPGGPIERMISEAGNMQNSGNIQSEQDQPLSEEQIEELKKYYGFDKPLITSYFIWIKKVLSGDLGISTRYYDPVWDMIKNRIPISLFFGSIALVLTYGICIPLGVLKAIKHKTLVDNITSIIIFTGYAIPGWVVGGVLMQYFASHLDILPLGGFVSDNFEELSLSGQIFDLIKHAVLPVTAYVAGSFAVMTVLMKNTLMDNLASDYVKTAIAKGLPFKTAVLKHAMRNSLIPLATGFGSNISIILSGSFLIEKVFNIDGMGLLGYESVLLRDYPVVMGILVISSILFLIGNILSDICVAFVDPRVQFE
ncbi:MAG: ABC transporter permease [Desulfobacterales bacterium]|nr:ABC transporter permease [Desulfobacterales bacterium]MCP4159254.1 ABC transporter permease [Deltaproteobacteria bacterium]